jgi:hypothetical protein
MTMGLIDKDALIKKLESNSWDIDEWELPFDNVTAGLKANAMDRETVEGMPTVDAVPVDMIKGRIKDLRKTLMDIDGDDVDEIWVLRTKIETLTELLDMWAERKEE